MSYQDSALCDSVLVDWDRAQCHQVVADASQKPYTFSFGLETCKRSDKLLRNTDNHLRHYKMAEPTLSQNFNAYNKKCSQYHLIQQVLRDITTFVLVYSQRSFGRSCFLDLWSGRSVTTYNGHGGISELTAIFNSPAMRISNVAYVVLYVSLMENTAGPSGRAV